MLVSSAASPTTTSAATMAVATSQRTPKRRPGAGRSGGGGSEGGAECGSVISVSSRGATHLHLTQCPTYSWQRMQEISSVARAEWTAGDNGVVPAVWLIMRG